MKTNEFRLGNIICLINRQQEIHMPIYLFPKIIHRIEYFSVQVLDLDVNPATVENWQIIDNRDISPIPLTEELAGEVYKSNNSRV